MRRIRAHDLAQADRAPYAGVVEMTGDDALLVTGVFLIVGSVGFTVIMWLGAIGRLPPNRWIGYRSDALLRNAVAWSLGHRAALPLVVMTSGAALVLAVTGLLLPWMIPKAAVLFLSAVALFGGGLRGQHLADQAAEEA